MPIQNGSLLPVTLGTQVDAKAVAFSVRIPWADFFTATSILPAKINLLSQFQTGRFTSVQAVYADNSTVPYQVRLTCDETGQTIVLPPFSQGFYKLLVSSSPTLTASLTVTQLVPGVVTPPVPCTTVLQFLNTKQDETQRQVGDTSLQSFSTELIFVAAVDVVPPYHDIAVPNVVVLPPPTTANTYLIIRSIALNVATLGYYPGPTFMGLRIGDPVTNYASAAWAGGDAANFGGEFNQVFTYEPPLIAPVVNTGLVMTVNPFIPTVGGPFPTGRGAVIVNAVITYGAVLIQ